MLMTLRWMSALILLLGSRLPNPRTLLSLLIWSTLLGMDSFVAELFLADPQLFLSRSVHLSVAKRYILLQMCLNKCIRNAPRNTVLLLSALYTDPIPSKSLLQKFRNFTYLLYPTLFTWLFCLCCYEIGRVLLWRWSLINVSFAVW